ncbi:MAG: hypothetical protein ACRDCE_12910 [Cetobacterium sp.]|uniref:hypothetical protein n=1 Tax=Cetobacterium sp. TaxID=2071632 RepID=UPI003EE4F3F8
MSDNKLKGFTLRELMCSAVLGGVCSALLTYGVASSVTETAPADVAVVRAELNAEIKVLQAKLDSQTVAYGKYIGVKSDNSNLRQMITKMTYEYETAMLQSQYKIESLQREVELAKSKLELCQSITNRK